MVQKNKNLLSVHARKRFGKPCYFGESIFGFSRFGDEHSVILFDDGESLKLSGIYQGRKLKHGKGNIKLNFYVPSNPRTASQQLRRTKFAEAVQQWQWLTPIDWALYNERVKNKNLSGYNLFIKEYMLS